MHVRTLSPALRFVIRAFRGDIREGDVFVNNAAYVGNAHVGDWTMLAPFTKAGLSRGPSTNATSSQVVR